MHLTVVVVILATLLSCVSAWTTCDPCRCYDGDFSDWKGLKVAECPNAQFLTSVPVSLPADIQGLSIDANSISKLEESQFKSYRHLQIINILQNKINQIEHGAFRYMTNVTTISLAFNEITELPSDCFTYTPNLGVVAFSFNKIKRLQTNLFNNLKYLKTVWLQKNEITTIEDHCFANVPQLEEIFLKNNKLISLDVNFINNVKSLKQLHLEENPWHCDTSLCGVLDAVVSGAMWGYWLIPTCATPQNLTGRRWSKELQKELCPCFPCQCTNSPPAALCSKPRQLNHVPSHLPTDLVQLNLTDTSPLYFFEGQQITVLTENDLSPYVRLDKLYLQYNQIQNLEVSVFNNLKTLNIISLCNNNLTALKTHQFANLPLLNEIDVSSNSINFIEEACLYNLPSLETVNLSRNKLKQLSLHFMDNTSNLKSLLLNGNPWSCDESLCGVMDTVVRRSLWGTEEVPACATPADLRGKYWHRIADAFQPQIISNTTSVIEGHDLELKCNYCFPSRLIWIFNTIKLSKNNQKVCDKSLTSSLTVNKVRREHQGYYVCHVKNCDDCEDAWLYLNVNASSESAYDLKQVLHVPDVNSSESCSSRRGLLLLHYTVVPDAEHNTTNYNKN